MSLTEAELDDKLEAHAAKVKALTDNAVSLIVANSARTESKAHLIGSGHGYAYAETGGDFLKGVMDAGSPDAERQAAGKASLDFLGISRVDMDAIPSKATLGTTDATGGWIIPNALVDELVKPSLAKNPYRQLMTFRTGITAPSVDIPFRSAAPARAVIAPFGSTKENVDLVYNGYTATMYTLARIHDMSKQMVRLSAGAAEADALSELAFAVALGESFYIREGSGSSQPYGFVTALQNAPAAFTSSHTAAAATVAGAVASAIAKAGSVLLGRRRVPEAAVISASGMAEMLTNGADAAGFFLSGISGPQAVPGLKPGTLVSPWGIPVYVDPDLAADDLIVAEWSAFKVYVGQEFRVDTSDTAGTRWDANLVGFRGEEELGFDGRPAVFAGAAQYVTDILS